MPTTEVPTLQEIVTALGGERPGTTEVVLLNQILTQIIANGSSSGGAVSSVFGRTGAVVAANGDYTPAQVGATTVGDAFFQLTNPSAVTYPRINADNSVDALSAANFLTAIGAAGLTANSFTGAQTVTLAPGANSYLPGLSLINSTAATVGNQQYSPSLILEGRSYLTTGGVSQPFAGEITAVPITEVFGQYGRLRMECIVNGTRSGFGVNIGHVGTGSDPTLQLFSPSSNSTLIGLAAHSNGWMFSASGTIFLMGNGLFFDSSKPLAWASGSPTGANNDTYLYRKAAAALQMGEDAAGVTNQMFTAASRITSDGVGANLTLAAGNGRGGAGGSLVFSTYTTAGAATIGTLTTRLTLDTLGMLTFADGVDMVFNTTTGTRIGIDPAQKLSFYGVAPVVQPAAIAVPTGTAGTGLDTVDLAVLNQTLLDIQDAISNIILETLEPLGLTA